MTSIKNQIEQIRFLFEEKVRKQPTVPQGFEVFSQPHLVQVRGPTAEAHDNWVYYSKLSESNVQASIEDTIHLYQEKLHAFEWKLFDYDPPATLKQHLLQAGFEEGSSEAWMTLDLNQKIIPCLNPSFQIREVQTELEFQELLKVQNQVWRVDLHRLIESLKQESQTNPNQLKIYQVYEEDKAVANGWIRFERSNSFASLFGGSTLAEYRRQGIYEQLMLHRALEAQKRGFGFLSVDASLMSEPVLQRIGFAKMANVIAMTYKSCFTL